MRGRDAGFTLLEILVALVVLGFLMAGLAQGTRFGLRAWGAQARLIDARAELDAVDRTLRRLIEGMDPGGPNQAPLIEGGRGRLAFTSEMPAAAMAVTRRADIALLVDAGSRLVLRWTPRLDAKRFGPPPPLQEAELLRGVARLELAYWPKPTPDAPAVAAGWRGSWAEPALPALVRVRLVFPPGDGRRWPDIVAAPMRERPTPQQRRAAGSWIRASRRWRCSAGASGRSAPRRRRRGAGCCRRRRLRASRPGRPGGAS